MRLTKEEERKFLLEPKKWPMYHILPVVARSDTEESKVDGFVHSSNLTRVYFSNLYSIRAKMERGALEYKDFPTPEALLAEYRID